MDEIQDDNQVEVSVGNKLVALFFAVLSFIWVGLVIVFAQLIVIPDMSFSDNPLIRFIGLIVCFAVAEKFYAYLTDGNGGKSMVMVIFTLLFILTIVAGVLLI